MGIPSDYLRLVELIEMGEVRPAVAEAERLNEAGHSLASIFQEAIVPCMTSIGDRFSSFELFLPDMIHSAEVVKAIHKALARRPENTAGTLEAPGKVVIGTVTGDVHDIGKNIVTTMLEVNGFQVFDIGVDADAMDFIRRARETNADIIALSSLMTTSIPYMKDVVELVRASENDRRRFKIMVGGGPVTAEVALKIGADAYGEDAADAVRQARRLLQNVGVEL